MASDNTTTATAAAPTERAAEPVPATEQPAATAGTQQATAPNGAAYTTLPKAEATTLKDVLCSTEARDVRAAGLTLLRAVMAFAALLLTVLVGYVEERQGVSKASQTERALHARWYDAVCRAAPGVQRVALSAGEFGVMVLAKMRRFSGPGAQSVVGPVTRTVMGVLPDDARRAVRAACDDEDGSNK